MEQADTIAAAGVTTIWLPPPTDSVSQQGYMPTDLYNLNSRYGSEDELRRWGMRCGEGMLLAACTQHNHLHGPCCRCWQAKVWCTQMLSDRQRHVER